MKFKRTGAAVMAAILAGTSMGIYADAAEDAAMKTALTYVKERIDIPEKYEDFDYRTRTYNGDTSYVFTWTAKSEDGNVSTISVTIVGKIITNVWIEDAEEAEWEPSFAKMSDAKLKAAAKKYINEINPTITSITEIDEDSLNIALMGNNAYMSFRRVKGGIPVTGQTGSVVVNKNTGELISYNYNYIRGATFSKSDNAISLSDAKKAYKKNFDSELMYVLENNWNSDEMKTEYTPHLIYQQTASGQINAFTGEVSTFDDYGTYAGGYDEDVVEEAVEEEAEMADMAAPNASAKAVTFSQAELDKLEKESKLISAEQALKSLQKMGIFFLPDSTEIESQYSSYNTQKGYYVRNVSFSSKLADYIDLNDDEVIPMPNYDYSDNTVWGNFTINAETGELLSFWNYNSDTGTDLDEKTGQAKAEAAYKKLLSKDKQSDFGSLEQTSENNVWEYDEKGKRIDDTKRTTNRYYKASREAYGIKCRDESLSLTVNNTGYITSYNINYNPEVEYPKPDNILTKNKAYTEFFKQVDFGLRYRCAYRTKDKKVVSALVYAADNTLRIDAFTGKLTNWDGSEITKAEQTGEYTDLEGSKYKKYADKLASYGIKLMDKDGKLNENDPIITGDLVPLLYNIGLYSYNYGNSKVEYPKDSAKLRRRDVAQILVTAKYGTEVAELKNIFKTNYTDVEETNDYIGYIAIADASGLLTGSNGKFRPDAYFTRGEALKYLYDFLSK